MLFIAMVSILLSMTLSMAIAATVPSFCHQLDCPKFSVVMQTNEFELRHYEPSVWVGTNQSNVDLVNFKTSQMFQKLFRYIDHNNINGQKIPMTAPVVTQFTPTSGTYGNVSMFFMIPFNLQANPPAPTDADVFIERAPEMWFYVKSYGGFNLFHTSDTELAVLKQDIERNGLLQYDNTVYFTAGYDSPFSFTNRHNEVWLMAIDTSPSKPVVG